ncbi:SixA phosphatase family protein [Pontibacter chitinilyticus]|uniref:SixA phosphatase family protein n=1 Tax=Pontibacter chitinilyticus TaxID=2674989 RepID=UPI00321942DA
MQRTLLICRHAETYDPYPLQPDFERELTPNGHLQATRTGQWIRDKFSRVDTLLASPARRANDTARTIAKRLYFDEEKISYLPGLYNAREGDLLRCLAALPQHAKAVLLVAHNPGITRLARDLSGTHIGYLEPGKVVAVKLEFEVWSDIYTATGTLLDDNTKQLS